jgi:hypothetical protein
VTLPSDYDARKAIPLASVLDYFADALADVAMVIRVGQAQHGTTGWDRAKSKDEESTLLRHFMDRGTLDVDGVRHSAKVAWRALALLQKEIEAARGDGKISRGSYDSSKDGAAPLSPRVTIPPGADVDKIVDEIHRTLETVAASPNMRPEVPAVEFAPEPPPLPHVRTSADAGPYSGT